MFAIIGVILFILAVGLYKSDYMLSLFLFALGFGAWFLSSKEYRLDQLIYEWIFGIVVLWMIGGAMWFFIAPLF